MHLTLHNTTYLVTYYVKLHVHVTGFAKRNAYHCHAKYSVRVYGSMCGFYGGVATATTQRIYSISVIARQRYGAEFATVSITRQ